jgi:hypothetical protein
MQRPLASKKRHRVKERCVSCPLEEITKWCVCCLFKVHFRKTYRNQLIWHREVSSFAPWSEHNED